MWPSVRSRAPSGVLKLGSRPASVHSPSFSRPGRGRLQHLAAASAPHLAAAHRDAECRLAILGHEVGVRAALEEQGEHIAHAIACGGHQGRAAAVRGQVHIRARFDEDSGRIDVVGAHRIAQGRPAVGVLGVEVGAIVHETFDLVHDIRVRGQHQRRGVPVAHGVARRTQGREGALHWGRPDLSPAAPSQARPEQEQRNERRRGTGCTGHGGWAGSNGAGACNEAFANGSA
mmetsp:Transcript_173276/g.550083  ORF Transcript_173276/g.550083 Transcript_173276/m.550083 type:complete len:231 (+) Transcript_173276:52-744(+)